MNNPLKTEFLGIEFKNPVIASSGTFGFGEEYQEMYDVSKLGGIASKGVTLESRKGNPGTRIWETPSGLLNSIGLENPGVEGFIKHKYQFMRDLGNALIVNLAGSDEESTIEGLRLLNEVDIDILELNISCPNVKAGGMAFGAKPETAGHITRLAKEVCRHPLMVKLTPNAENVADVAQACEEAGADAISLVNCFLGMAIDIENKKPVFHNVYAGMSGAAIKPIALRMVHQVCKRVTIPISGLGGITTVEDAIEFIIAGATTIQIGAGNFYDPYLPLKVIEGLQQYCEKEGLKNISEIRGIV